MLLQVSVRELHNNIVSEPVYGGIKEARYADNSIIISDYTFRSLLKPQLKKCHQDTRSCVVVNVVYMPKLYIPHNYHGVTGIKKKLKYQRKNSQNKRSGEKSNCIYETYKNTVMSHGRHIYAKAYDMEKAKLCAYPQSDHALPYWKCVMLCCAKCTSLNIPEQETDDQYSNTSP